MIYITIEKQTTKDYMMKMTLDLNKIFRKIESQKRGWVIIDQSDRDWHFGKPLETKDLQEIVQKMKKMPDLS